MKKLYAYSDEATFHRGTDRITGTGILFTKTPITEEIIKNALSKLKVDEDFDLKKDSRTIQRGYFHGSEDSKNAHSYLCREIVKNIEGSFTYSYIKQGDITNKLEDQEKYNRLTLQLASTKLFQGYYDVDLVVEERTKFNNIQAQKFISRFYFGVEVLSYKLPSIINLFPKLNVKVAGKKNIGLQVVDFILWAMNRSFMSPPDNIWRDRLELKMSDHFKVEDGSEFGGNFYLKQNLLGYNLDLPINYPYPVPDDMPKAGAHVINYYIYIEELIELFFKQKLPLHAQHIYEYLEKSMDYINQPKSFDEKKLKFICSSFIKVFDTIPIYAELENEDVWLDTLYSKRLAGLIIRNDGIHNGRTRDSILRWKHSIVESTDE